MYISPNYRESVVCRIDHLGKVVNTVLVRPFAPERGKARNIFELESLILFHQHFQYSHDLTVLNILSVCELLTVLIPH